LLEDKDLLEPLVVKVTRAVLRRVREGNLSILSDKCQTKHDRDINAAINIRTVGTTGIAFGKTNTQVCGLGISN